MKYLVIAAAAASLLATTQSDAAPITIGGTTFDGGLNDFPTFAEVISGETFSFGGVSCTEGLIGADIDTGCFNLGLVGDAVVRLDFSRSFGNAEGADIYFTDARFSEDGLSFSLNGSNFFTIEAGDFTDTGVNSAIRNAVVNTFDLFAASLDLSDYGFAAGGNYSSIWISGIGEADPIVVGLLNSEAAVIPLPATLPLLATGLGLFGFASLRRRNA